MPQPMRASEAKRRMNSAWRPADERLRADQATRARLRSSVMLTFTAAPSAQRLFGLRRACGRRPVPASDWLRFSSAAAPGLRKPRTVNQTPLRPNQRMKLTRTYVKVDLGSMGRAAYP